MYVCVLAIYVCMCSSYVHMCCDYVCMYIHMYMIEVYVCMYVWVWHVGVLHSVGPRTSDSLCERTIICYVLIINYLRILCPRMRSTYNVDCGGAYFKLITALPNEQNKLTRTYYHTTETIETVNRTPSILNNNICRYVFSTVSMG